MHIAYGKGLISKWDYGGGQTFVVNTGSVQCVLKSWNLESWSRYKEATYEGCVLGKTYIEIWVRWTRDARAVPYEKPSWQLILLRVVSALLFVIGSYLFVSGTMVLDPYQAAAGFVFLFSGWMGWSFYAKRPFGSNAAERLNNTYKLARKSVPGYIERLGIEKDKLVEVLASIKDYYYAESKKRESFRNKVFSFLCCGVMIQLLTLALQSSQAGDAPFSLAISVLCSVMVVFAFAILGLWDVLDVVRTASLMKTQGAIRVLECYMLDVDTRKNIDG